MVLAFFEEFVFQKTYMKLIKPDIAVRVQIHVKSSVNEPDNSAGPSLAECKYNNSYRMFKIVKSDVFRKQ